MSGALPIEGDSRMTSADDGLVTKTISNNHAATVARVIDSLARHGVPLVARIDHAAAARAAGLLLPATEVLIFGNPQAGTPLMAARPAIAIDLPLKLAVQATPDGQTMLTYVDPAWLARRHGLPAEYDAIVNRMRGLLNAIVKDAAAADAP
jgi:uncharacterized protein (DUF302 family)